MDWWQWAVVIAIFAITVGIPWYFYPGSGEFVRKPESLWTRHDRIHRDVAAQLEVIAKDSAAVLPLELRARMVVGELSDYIAKVDPENLLAEEEVRNLKERVREYALQGLPKTDEDAAVKSEIKEPILKAVSVILTIAAVAWLISTAIEQKKETNAARREYEKEVEHWVPAAESGDPLAQCALGRLYSSVEIGAPQDFQRAYSWFERSAMQGHACGQFGLGLLYENSIIDNSYGERIRQFLEYDWDTMIGWYRKAAVQGDRYAKYRLGLNFRSMAHIDEYAELAQIWFLSAALAGHPQARYQLGMMLYQGLGVPEPEPIEALAWLSLAAEEVPETISPETVEELIVKELTPAEAESVRKIIETYRR